MAETATLYECPNENCPLGTMGSAGGQFTGGMTAEQVNLLTGKPIETLEEGTDFGEGICPNCGTQGTEIGEHVQAESTPEEAPVPEEVTE